MNPFQLMPEKLRAAFYLGYASAALAVTSVAGGYGAINHEVPQVVLWIGGALVPIGSMLGVTAASNIVKQQAAPAPVVPAPVAEKAAE